MGRPRISEWGALLGRINQLLAKAGIPCLLLLAFVYYGLYYRTGLNLGGEGGTNAVLAMRLMEGQRPIVDTFLGYNLMWFYPLVALFSVTGPDYVAMRIFFFVMCAVTAVLGFVIVRKATGQAWLAVAVGVLLVLIPGMLFRNYMGLIGVLSIFLLLKGFVFDAETRWKQIVWMGLSGAGLGLCYMVRIEPSLLISIVWCGLILLYPLGRERIGREVVVALAGGALGVALLLAVHLPFAWHAHKSGFGEAFVSQYSNFINLLRYELSAEFAKFEQSPASVHEGAKDLTIAPVEGVEPAAVGGDEARDGRRSRPAITEAFGTGTARERSFVAMIYYPVAASLLFVPLGCLLVLTGIWWRDMRTKEDGLLILVGIGCSLSLFPQYYFFRPDAPHLSEFMVPFTVALAVSATAVLRSAWRQGALALRVAALVAAGFAALSVPLYMKAIMPRESAGTIVKSRGWVEFEALNGVRVKLPPDSAADMEGLRDAILKNSGSDDYVVCYPYSPTINFLTDRRSYEYNLYVDNATAGIDFQNGAIQRLETFRPAVVVIDNRAINNTAESRFMNWAGVFMDHLKANYRHLGTYHVGSKENLVFVRNSPSPFADSSGTGGGD
jgi:hypothetical protein